MIYKLNSCSVNQQLTAVRVTLLFPQPVGPIKLYLCISHYHCRYMMTIRYHFVVLLDFARTDDFWF